MAIYLIAHGNKKVTVQPASHSPPLCGCPLHTPLPAVTYGRTPYVKS